MIKKTEGSREGLTETQERILRAVETLDSREGKRLRLIQEIRRQAGLCLSACRRNLKALVGAGFLEEFSCGVGRAHGLRYKRKESTGMKDIERIRTGSTYYLLLSQEGELLPTAQALTNEADACNAAKALLRSEVVDHVLVCRVADNLTPVDLPPVVIHVKPPPVQIEGKPKITLWSETRRLGGFYSSEAPTTCQAVGCETKGEYEISFDPAKDRGEPEDTGHRVVFCSQHMFQFREEHCELEVYRGSLDPLWIVTAKGRGRRPKPEPEETEE